MKPVSAYQFLLVLAGLSFSQLGSTKPPGSAPAPPINRLGAAPPPNISTEPAGDAQLIRDSLNKYKENVRSKLDPAMTSKDCTEAWIKSQIQMVEEYLWDKVSKQQMEDALNACREAVLESSKSEAKGASKKLDQRKTEAYPMVVGETDPNDNTRVLREERNRHKKEK